MKRLLLLLIASVGLAFGGDYMFTPYGSWYPCEHYGMFCDGHPRFHSKPYILLINNNDFPAGTTTYFYVLDYLTPDGSFSYSGTVERFDDGYNWTYVIIRSSEEIQVTGINIWGQ